MKKSNSNMPSAKTLVATAASVAASAMVVRSVARDLLPYELQHFVLDKIRTILQSLSPEIILIIEEIDGLVNNQIYKAADIYLGSKIPPYNKIFKVSMPEKSNSVITTMAKDQEIIDTFNGANFTWRQFTEKIAPKRVQQQGHSSSYQYETNFFHLTFHKKHKEMVFESYFPFILKESKRLREERKTLKIHTLSSDYIRKYSPGDSAWTSVNLDHPSTFETLAMDGDLKKDIIADLETFVKRREFYKRVGKAWKRGYLLYGPPGTGKSSLIAAMANYLKFDIYDLELTDIQENSELRRLVVGTANRSILVIEDIDCSLDLDERSEEARVLKTLKSAKANKVRTVNIHKQQEKKVTLSGLLNFIDGLWSCCGDERIIIFTTNHKDRLDPALLRPGRMDMHIHMSYCTPSSFKTLAFNYLGTTEHPLFLQVEPLLENTKVTPAEVAEQLLKKVDTEDALGGLIEFLHTKKRENDEMEERKLKEEEERKLKEEEEKKEEERDSNAESSGAE